MRGIRCFAILDAVKNIVALRVLAELCITLAISCKPEVMKGLPRCAELQRSPKSMGWEESMILYYLRSIIEDCMMARETNRLYEEVVAMVEERAQFLQELNSLLG
ncbi:hypothetical protein Tco_0738831 [Tanacetum coccineum]